ncbi:MAG: SRPBCC family protein [Solirubrobacterales bacterium]
MKIEHSFEIEAPMEKVWATMIDVERVAPCLPGAELTGASEGVYEGTFTVKLGPTTAVYAGKLEMEAVDEPARRVTMKASGQDKRGQGAARATIRSSMSESAGITTVDVETDFTLTGRLARFGRGGMIKDVSDRLLGEFVACLRDGMLAPAAASSEGADFAAPDARPIRGLGLFLSIAWQRIKGIFRRSR